MSAQRRHGKDAGTVPSIRRSAVQQSVLRDRVRLLYAALPLSQLVAFLVALVLFGYHATGRLEAPLAWWFAVTSLVLAGRGASNWLYRHRWSVLGDDQRWLAAYRLGAALSGLAWGATGVLLFPTDNPSTQALTILVLAGVTGGALSSMAADHVAYRGFVLLALSPVAGIALTRSTRLELSIGLLVVLMALFLYRSSRAHTGSIVDSLVLRYENTHLLADLENEKARLISDADTMINKVLSCAPIGLWSIDNDTQVTYCDVERLGWTTRAGRPPQIGDSLIEAVDNHPQLT